LNVEGWYRFALSFLLLKSIIIIPSTFDIQNSIFDILFLKLMQKKKFKLILISTPWPLYNRPSIQLGALKAYLQTQHPDVNVHADHAFLKIAADLGYRLYQEISERTWLAEAVYAALLYPQRTEVVKTFFNRHAQSGAHIGKTRFSDITAVVKKTTDALIDDIAWQKYQLAGFSVSLCQLTSALYFIKRIKQRYPHLIIAIGGSTFSGATGPRFFDLFADVDLVVNGEGELPFSRLVGHLKASAGLAGLPPIEGVVTAATVKSSGAPTRHRQMKNLKDLPPPDYDDYFRLLKSLAPPKRFFPTLAVETSRGCWWQRPTKAGNTNGCAFCNLNLQWQGYRTKDPGQVAGEIDHLTSTYQTLAVSFVDNVLPKRDSKEIFNKLIGLQKDLRMFSEIRATTPRPELNLMARAGMQEVQIGIEALATSLLAKLNKGTTAIQNLEIMRDCETLGLINYANLILHFPGSDEQDVAETLRSLEFALPYRPLKAVGFWLGLGSPVWQNPGTYGIKAVFNHPNWACLFPKKITTSLRFMIQAYRGDLGYQRKIWRPVEKALKQWQQAYSEQKCRPEPSPSLYFRDGREFMIIRQRQLRAETLNHRLVGTSRQIYLYCQHHRSINRIRDRFPAFAEDKIRSFLKMMVSKKLIYEEKDRYLSLAIPVKRF
jgi:ribosomal peptide maturation radical SAM protein 1